MSRIDRVTGVNIGVDNGVEIVETGGGPNNPGRTTYAGNGEKSIVSNDSSSLSEVSSMDWGK